MAARNGTTTATAAPLLSPFRTSLLAATEVLTVAALVVFAAALAAAAALSERRGGAGHARRRRVVAARCLRGLAALVGASAAAAYYAEARFSVVVSYSAAAAHNPLVRVWLSRDRSGDCGGCHHFLLWVYVPCALVVCCAALGGAELLMRGQHQPAVPRRRDALPGRRAATLLWHVRHGKLTLALALVAIGSIGVPVGRTVDRAGVHQFGADWEPHEHSGLAFWQHMLERSSLYAGMGALIPMSLIGIPLSRTSALWRALGRSFEEAVAFHRALGHLMMGMLTYHSVGYLVEWASRGLHVLAEELTDWLRCGRCTHVNNLAGLIAWIAGLVIWASSVDWFRRRNYAAFFSAHQLHLLFFGFGCIHWPACIAYAGPSVVFYVADLALRRHVCRGGVPAVARLSPSDSGQTTLVIPCLPPSHAAPAAAAAATCPLSGVRGTCPLREAQGGDEWSGGCLYLAVPSLGRLPYLQWHPFTAIQDGAALVVHASPRMRWTRGLATLAGASPPATDDGADELDYRRDRCLHMCVIGPMPAPPALLGCVSEARAGSPLLLIGGGSGLVPLVAILRRLACGRMPSDAHVTLAVVVREACALEQLMDGRMLPVEAGTGETGYPWLHTRIFITAKGKGGSNEGAPGRDATALSAAEDGRPPEKAHDPPLASVRGPFRVELSGEPPVLRATAAPYQPPPAFSPNGQVSDVPLPVYEAASLTGAVVGFLSITWPLMWRDSRAPWGAHVASTSVAGGGGFVAASACAFAGAALLLALCDGVAWLRPWRALGRRRLKTLPVACEAGAVEVSSTGDPPGPSPSSKHVSSSPGASHEARARMAVPIAGWGRPDMDALLRRSPPGACVAAGGPSSMLNALSASLAKAGRPPFVCLTQSL